MWLDLDPMQHSNLRGMLKITLYLGVLMVYAAIVFYAAFLAADTQVATDIANAVFGR